MENNIIMTIREKQKLQFWAIIGIACLVIAVILLIFFLANRSQRSGQDEAKRLQEQNNKLTEHTTSLVKTVNSLNSLVLESKAKDSVLVLLTQANTKLLPGINARITKINNDYEKNISDSRNFDANQVRDYIANEARRIRSGEGERFEAGY